MTNIATEVARLKSQIDQIKKGQRLSHGASIENAAIEVRDDGGSLRAIVGQQGDGTTGAIIVNGPPPPQPSAPLVASVLGGVTASWDGQFDGGAVMPLDWARVEVHASTAPDFIPDPVTLQSTIETAQGATAVIACENDVYVRLQARTTSGTASTPSSIVGPYGPAPVVATDILDGIVTTVKLADDAVTQAKVAVGAIGTTEISDSAITTPKIVAGAVQTAQLDAEAVNASKIAAGAVTTTKLDALAVTADKIDANAVIVGKLAAGSVDATALKADAITGKTITGGVINGAEFHSDDGAGSLVDIQDGTVTTTAANGWKIVVDPTQALPVIDFLDGEGDTAGSINATGDNASPALNISSGPFTDGAVTDWRWVTVMGQTSGANACITTRVRESNTNTFKGGYLALNPSNAQLALVDSASPTTNTIFQIEAQQFIFDEGRVIVDPPASTFPALAVLAKSGHTGTLIRCQVNSVDKFYVTPAGNVVASGSISGASVTATGAVTAGSATATGAVTAGSITTAGAVTAASATISGLLAAGNIAFGTIVVTTSAANSPASAAVTGLNVAGTTFRAFVTGSSGVPGTQFLGAAATNPTANGMTVTVTRTNATATSVYWLLLGI
ncbi:hypothetical protein [Streptomyces sp. NPDC048445]|uniref:hypothetical protein n=1 Tax=Streptomyces sp. NPDC048445 TaxID=3365553 RepID=UPI00370FEA02